MVAVVVVVVTAVVAAAGAVTAVVAAVGSREGFSAVMGCVAAAVTFSKEAIGGGAARSWSPELVVRVRVRKRLEVQGARIGNGEGGRRYSASSI